MTKGWTAEEIAERIKAEVVEDVRGGRVPADVATFSELHDYVDANDYFDLGGDDCPLDPGREEDCTVLNAASSIVDGWLWSGGLKAAL